MRKDIMRFFLIGILFSLLFPGGVFAKTDLPWRTGSETTSSPSYNTQADDDAEKGDTVRGVIWNAIIEPHRSVDVSSEVDGVIRCITTKEGERVQEGSIIVELVQGRYKDVSEKAKARIAALEAEMKQAEENLRIENELFLMKASTKHALLKAKTEVAILEARIQESEKELEIAKRDLDSCRIKSPFTGYMALWYKRPGEAVHRLESIFSVVDSSSVYAVAHVDEHLVPAFEVGAKAAFVHRSGKRYEGKVERISPISDPKSKTRKVYCLIGNAAGSLSVGMTGSLRPSEQ